MSPLMMCVLVSSFRSANVFSEKRANTQQVRTSIEKFGRIVNEESGTHVMRDKVVDTDADDIVFDAVVGSRSGRVRSDIAKEKIQGFHSKSKRFETYLLFAQLNVLFSQTILVLGQLTAVACLIRVIRDVTTLTT